MKKGLIALLGALMLMGIACAGEEPEPSAEDDGGETIDVSAEIETIESLLDDVESTHAEGDSEAAAEIAAEAYLEHYEHIEHDVEEADEALNEELEELLGVDLRDALQDGISDKELDDLLSEIRTLLDQAETAVGPGTQ